MYYINLSLKINYLLYTKKCRIVGFHFVKILKTENLKFSKTPIMYTNYVQIYKISSQ